MKSRPRAFPTEVFLASASVIAVIVCLGGCLAAGRAGEDFAFGVYAAGFAGQMAAFLWTLKLFRGKKWLEYGLRKRHTA